MQETSFIEPVNPQNKALIDITVINRTMYLMICIKLCFLILLLYMI